MTYATKQNMIDRFSQEELQQLTDRATPPAGAIDDTVLNRALDDASSEIDGYLAARYPAPLTPVPEIIERFCCVIARWMLYKDGAPDKVTDEYKAAVRMLENLAKGVASLSASGSGAAPTTVDGVQFEGGQKVFAREPV